MTTFSIEQRFIIAEALLHEQYPDVGKLETFPFYVQSVWLSEADKAIAGYNLIMKLIDSGVIQ